MASPTQDFVQVKEIRDGIVVLKDGGLRAVLMTSSVNFALKGAEEQQGTILQFQSFLNSLDFPVQIYIQSRELDIGPYLDTLEQRYKDTIDELLRIQIREYIEFIRTFVENANIMEKNFFVIVPYDPALIKVDKPKFSLPLFSSKDKKENYLFSKEDFTYFASQLDQRIAIVQQGLTRMGIKSVQLDTEEVIELFYKIYNPTGEENAVEMLQANQNNK